MAVGRESTRWKRQDRFRSRGRRAAAKASEDSAQRLETIRGARRLQRQDGTSAASQLWKQLLLLSLSHIERTNEMFFVVVDSVQQEKCKSSSLFINYLLCVYFFSNIIILNSDSKPILVVKMYTLKKKINLEPTENIYPVLYNW